MDWWYGKVPQSKLVEGVPEMGGIVYKKHIIDYSEESYDVEYCDSEYTITGLTCVPVDEETQSPNARVIEGGINRNHVTIRLTPVESGKWGCDVVICGKRRA
jgi:hypothetical protein